MLEAAIAAVVTMNIVAGIVFGIRHYRRRNWTDDMLIDDYFRELN